MRIIIFSPFYSKEELFFSLPYFFYHLNNLQKRKLVFYDFVTEVDDFEYYCFVRNYDVSFIFYEEELKFKYLNSLRWIKKSNYRTDAYFLTDLNTINDKNFKENLIKKYSAKEIFYNDKKIMQRKDPINELLPEIIDKKMLNIPSDFEFDLKNKKIFYFNLNKDRILLPFKKKLDFNVMHCFLLNKDKILSIEQIANFCSLLPEEVNNLIIENSITSIRRTFQKMNLLGKMDIVSKKKIGYVLTFS